MWNYRVLAHQDKEEIFMKIHEVYYDESGKPNGYTENAVSASGETTDEILSVLNRMKECCKRPVLWAGEKFPLEFKITNETT